MLRWRLSKCVLYVNICCGLVFILMDLVLVRRMVCELIF